MSDKNKWTTLVVVSSLALLSLGLGCLVSVMSSAGSVEWTTDGTELHLVAAAHRLHWWWAFSLAIIAVSLWNARPISGTSWKRRWANSAMLAVFSAILLGTVRFSLRTFPIAEAGWRAKTWEERRARIEVCMASLEASNSLSTACSGLAPSRFLWIRFKEIATEAVFIHPDVTRIRVTTRRVAFDRCLFEPEADCNQIMDAIADAARFCSVECVQSLPEPASCYQACIDNASNN